MPLAFNFMNKFNKKVERKLMENAADLQTQLVESITHVRTVKEFGIDATRIETEGKGESESIAKNDSVVNKALNRRVEFLKL